jgi:hypothetical protein
MPALVAGIQALRHHEKKDVDGRDKPGHDKKEDAPGHDDREANSGALKKFPPNTAPWIRRRASSSRPWSGSGSARSFLAWIAASLGLLSDPDPNPIGPGLFAFFTFWSSGD